MSRPQLSDLRPTGSPGREGAARLGPKTCPGMLRSSQALPGPARPVQAFMLGREPGAGGTECLDRRAALIINQFWKIGSELREERAGKNLENWNTSGNYGGLYSGISNGLNTRTGLNGSGTKSWEYFILLWQEHDLLNRQPFLLWSISQHKQKDAETSKCAWTAWSWQ